MGVKALLALLGALVLGGGARAADITARYVLPTYGNAVMTIEADGQGNSRIRVDGETGVVITGGIAYFVTTDEDGLVVVRRDDALAAIDEMMRGGPQFPVEPVALRAGGPADDGLEPIAGHPGRRWILSGPAPRSGFVATLVLSDDRELAPVGRAMAMLAVESPYVGGMVGGTGLTVQGPPEVMALIRRGTILRFTHLARLESVSRAPIPPSAFVLPAPPMTRAEYLQRRQREGRSSPF
jgi:hypothetical protein